MIIGFGKENKNRQANKRKIKSGIGVHSNWVFKKWPFLTRVLRTDNRIKFWMTCLVFFHCWISVRHIVGLYQDDVICSIVRSSPMFPADLPVAPNLFKLKWFNVIVSRWFSNRFSAHWLKSHHLIKHTLLKQTNKKMSIENHEKK